MTENPFLIPPGSVPPPKRPVTPKPTPEPMIAPPVAPPARDPDSYIALPPSVESATHRLGRPETPPPTPAAEQIAEETRVAPPLASSQPVTAWSLVLPDGSRIPVTGPILLGRDPAPIAERPTATLVALTDPGKTVSKTHALFEPVSGVMRIQDLHSTNGVAITVNGARTVLPAGGEGIALVGADVELGSFTVLVDGR